MKKVTTKKTRSVNNRPNCLKITKGTQKVNFTTVTDKDGKKIKTSVSEARTMNGGNATYRGKIEIKKNIKYLTLFLFNFSIHNKSSKTIYLFFTIYTTRTSKFNIYNIHIIFLNKIIY